MNLIKQKHDYIQMVESNYLSNYERVNLNFNLVKVLYLWAQEKVSKLNDNINEFNTFFIFAFS